MDEFQQLRVEARERLKNADHLITKAYPAVKDSRLLLAAIGQLSSALDISLSSVLSYEMMAGRMPHCDDNPDSRFLSFEKSIAPRLINGKKYINLVSELRELIRFRKESPIEFSRGEKYVIASGDYELKEIDETMAKALLDRAREFIETMEIMVSKG